MFAPGADAKSNPDNRAINIRSYGEDPRQVTADVKAFIEGARRLWVLVTAKHFPGQGDAAVDTHAGPAKVVRLDLAPFREAIAAGVDAVMTGHLSVPELESRKIPATVSPEW